MIAIAKHTLPQPITAATQNDFLDMLPHIRSYARTAFRGLNAEARDEALQEVTANCYVAYTRLVERGRASIAYPAVLARYAIVQYREGRRVGGRLSIRDVSSGYAQKRKSFVLQRLDKFDIRTNDWREVLVEDRTATPAEIAATRIDFAAWLRSLPLKVRRIAKTLAVGETTTNAARKSGVSFSRISQLRRELKASWEAFVGEQPKLVAA